MKELASINSINDKVQKPLVFKEGYGVSPGSNEKDLLQFLTDVKAQIGGLISKNVSQSARNISFIAEEELFESTEAKETSLLIHSGIQPVYDTELHHVDFLAIVGQKLNRPFTLKAFGSGWILNKRFQND